MYCVAYFIFEKIDFRLKCKRSVSSINNILSLIFGITKNATCNPLKCLNHTISTFKIT